MIRRNENTKAGLYDLICNEKVPDTFLIAVSKDISGSFSFGVNDVGGIR